MNNSNIILGSLSESLVCSPGNLSVDFLLQIINSISDPMFVKDHQHRFFLLNDAFCQFMGYEREDIIGKSDYDLFPQVEARESWKKEELVFTSNTTFEYEEYFTDAFGLTHFVASKKSVFTDDTGNQYLTCIIRDITKSKLTEEALRQSERKDIIARKKAEKQQAMLVKILEATSDYVAISNDEGNFIYINRAGREMLGIGDDEDISNMHFMDIFPDSMTQTLEKQTEKLFAEGIWRGESFLQRRDGSVIPVSQVSMIHQSENDEVEFFSDIIRDITEIKQTEAELLNSRQRLALLIEQTPIGVIKWSPDFEVRQWNPASEKIFGYSRDEVLGWGCDFLVPESEKQHIDEVKTKLLGQKIPVKSVNENITKDGKIIICEWYNSALVNADGELVGVSSMILDITERVQTEKLVKQKTEELESALDEIKKAQMRLIQSEKMSSLGQLVAGVAHEINNPTSFIYGNLCHAHEFMQDLLRMVRMYQRHYPHPALEIQDFAEEIDFDFVVEDLPKLLHSMKVGAQRIREIVLGLRTFSRMDESGMKKVDIHEGIDSTLMILQHRLKPIPGRPAIEVIKKYGDLPLVECYPGQLNQVFMNILANGIDALEESLFNAHLSFLEEEKQIINPQIAIQTKVVDGTQVIICINDNGSGIPESVKQQIFDPFFTTKPVGKGTGMGLSISYQIITERHGGSLECFSCERQGTSFVITIPLSQKKTEVSDELS
jgi:two-component system, NtrC family, sensor kinase